jgi:hypothetical protein
MNNTITEDEMIRQAYRAFVDLQGLQHSLALTRSQRWELEAILMAFKPLFEGMNT